MKITKEEFHNKIFELFKDDRNGSNYKEYFDFSYQKYKYLQNRYNDDFGIRLPFSEIGDETMEKLGISREKWEEITADIWRKEKQRGLTKIICKIVIFVESAKILGFSFDFDDLAEVIDIEAEKIADYLLD